MNGADTLLRAAALVGIDACFANPGTTEMELVAALDRAPQVRPVLALFEGVATGAADGFGRVAGRPALTLTHLGPGFANGIANLHNARRAHTPIVNLVGDHPTWHVGADAPLTSDIASLARPVSRWYRSATSSRGIAADLYSAFGAAMKGGVATLVVPQDCAWDDAEEPAKPPRLESAAAPSATAAARALSGRGERKALLLLGGRGLRTAGLRAAARIAASGVTVLTETFPAVLDRGAGVPSFPRLPYFPEQVTRALEGVDVLVLAGAREPVAFFGYRDGASHLVPNGCEVVALAEATDDVVGALEDLADGLGAVEAPPVETKAVPIPTGDLTVGSLGAALAALQPDGAVAVDEGATSGAAYTALAPNAPPHLALGLTGGAIGLGLPMAVGAAVAAPDRRVVALQADGSGMYTVQALWTMARESLDVTVVLCANRKYRILQVELQRAGITEPGPAASALTDLGDPPIDWVHAARGFGVPAVQVSTAYSLVEELRRSFAEPGPRLIEALLP